MQNPQPSLDFWELPNDQKISVFEEIKDSKKISLKAAEKDWWVSHVIRGIFSLRCAEALTFKGGTSLSKAWGVTERFSEDVDISFDKSFFGLTGETRSARDRIRKLTRKYIHEEVLKELPAVLYVYGANKSEVWYRPRPDSDADPTVLQIPYYTILPDDPYIKPVIKVEFSCRNLREPREIRRIEPFVTKLSPAFIFPDTEIPTVVPTRTFLEKVFLLHEEFQKNYPRFRRMSRHLYDLYRLDKCGYADKAIADTDLYRTLVQHRSTFNAIRGIDYSRHTPELLRIIPPEEVLPLWEADYQQMQEQFIYGDSPSFKDLLKALSALQDRLHTISL